MRSATIGLRLCGIADEPFWPRRERLLHLARPRCARGGGSRARTSRATPRRRRARRAARRAGRAGGSASSAGRARARAARRRCARPRDRSPRTSRPRPRACRRASPRAHAATRARPRSSSNAQPASFSPKVVGSAWTPCVRPIQIVSRCSSARRDDGGERAVDPFEDQRAGLADLQRERGVEDVRGGEAVVQPAPVLRRAARRPRRRTRPGRAGCAPRSRRRAPASAAARSRGSPRPPRRDRADLGEALERSELDLEPARELRLVRPDPAMAGRE